MKPTHSPVAFLTKVFMLGIPKLVICEGFVDRAVIFKIAESMSLANSVDVRIPKEVDSGVAGKSAVRALAEYLVLNGFEFSLPGINRTVKLGVYMDSDLDLLLDKRINHALVSYSSGYCIENDIFIASDLVAAASKCSNTSGLFSTSALANNFTWIRSCAAHWMEWGLICCAVQTCAVHGIKGFGRVPPHSNGWLPQIEITERNRIRTIIDQTFVARGLDAHTQFEVIRTVLCEHPEHLDHIFCGKWYAIFFVEFIVAHLAAAGRVAPSRGALDSCSIQCVLDSVDIRHRVFDSETNLIRNL